MNSPSPSPRKRRRWPIYLVAVVAIAAIVALEPTQVIRGYLKGEPFYLGRPSGYWRSVIMSQLQNEDVMSSKLKVLTDRQAFDVLERCINDVNPTVRAVAVRVAAVGASQIHADSDHVQQVTKRLQIARINDQDKRVRSAAIGGLNNIERTSDARQRHLLETQIRPADELILRNMPMNSDLRCMGISTVAEALLESRRSQGETSVKQLSQTIYMNWTSGNSIVCPGRLTFGDKTFLVSSTAALNQLSTEVADLYKQHYEKLLETDAGRQQLQLASQQFIRNERALNDILEVDPDLTEVFCGVGLRQFRDGRIKRTNHAFLIRKLKSGRKVVFDPNDPGRPIQCKLVASDEGINAEWRCLYRNTGEFTTQKYRLIHAQVYFRVFLGKSS